MKSGTLMALSFAASIGILLCGYAAGRITAEKPVEPQCEHVEGYQVVTSIDTLYVTGGSGDTLGKIPYSDTDSLWSIIMRDND